MALRVQTPYLKLEYFVRGFWQYKLTHKHCIITINTHTDIHKKRPKLFSSLAYGWRH